MGHKYNFFRRTHNSKWLSFNSTASLIPHYEQKNIASENTRVFGRFVYFPFGSEK